MTDWRDFSNPVAKLSRQHPREDQYWVWAYHTTHQDLLPQIAATGLQANWHEHVEDAPVIFVEPTLEGLAPYIDKNSVVLRFKTPGFGSTEDGEDVIFSEESRGTFSQPLEGTPGEPGYVPPERLQLLVGREWRWLVEEARGRSTR